MKKRMLWQKELRWLLASYLIRWALSLVEREASDDTVKAFDTLAANFRNKLEFDTVPMRQK